jgi:glycosyltransferase involved in cell wall biosynthesis
MIRLTVLICTHNRASLLGRTLFFLNQCERPPGAKVDLLVVANACTDNTLALLDAYPAVLNELLEEFSVESPQYIGAEEPLALKALVEPAPGKSNALNRALSGIDTDLIAMVDDDHRVDRHYLVAVTEAARAHPQATMFCGRILPDWDGREPAWVHQPTPFPVYPLPVPRFDHGTKEMALGLAGPTPGGGNLVLRKGVFERVGKFSVELGPKGHNLAGSEDSDFVKRALKGEERLRYSPTMVQYHYVDTARMTLGYIMRKAYERSRTLTLVHREPGERMPKYFFRKLANHVAGSLFSLYWPERRFHLVRAAATLGEMRGHIGGLNRGAGPDDRAL